MQENLELCLLQSQNQYLQLCIAFSLPMWVCMINSRNWLFLIIISFKYDLFTLFFSIFPQNTGSAGLGFLQFCNLNTFRTKFILGFSIFMGFSIPQYFNEYTAFKLYGPVHTHARWVTNFSHPFSLV